MEEEFALFNAWVDRRLGIPLAAYKENQMQRRILTIMENSGAKTLREYQQLIEGDDGVRAAFLAHITINVTEFYRNKELFDAFERVLKTIVLPKTPLPKNLECRMFDWGRTLYDRDAARKKPNCRSQCLGYRYRYANFGKSQARTLSRPRIAECLSGRTYPFF